MPEIERLIDNANHIRECLGLYNHQPDGALWAASFDAALPEEWYENVDNQHTSARAKTPAEAIMAAARRFQEFTNEIIFATGK